MSGRQDGVARERHPRVGRYDGTAGGRNDESGSILYDMGRQLDPIRKGKESGRGVRCITVSRGAARTFVRSGWKHPKFRQGDGRKCDSRGRRLVQEEVKAEDRNGRWCAVEDGGSSTWMAFLRRGGFNLEQF